jgi:hypothetical protein
VDAVFMPERVFEPDPSKPLFCLEFDRFQTPRAVQLDISHVLRIFGKPNNAPK